MTAEHHTDDYSALAMLKAAHEILEARIGRTSKGQPIMITVDEAALLFTGEMGSGKTSAKALDEVAGLLERPGGRDAIEQIIRGGRNPGLSRDTLNEMINRPQVTRLEDLG